MPKYRVLVECRNEGGADIHCWSGIEAPNGVEAERLAVQRASRHYLSLIHISEPTRP